MQEPGNKVYFDDLDAYFNCHPTFVMKGKRFTDHIVPLLKVRRANSRIEPFWYLRRLLPAYQRNRVKLDSNC